MKEKQKQKQSSEPLSREMLLRRNPVPFGDVRKYYYAGMIGTVVLLVLCFHISITAIVLRTSTCMQIPNVVIIVLLLCSVLNVIGHHSRTIIGYGLSAVACLIVVLLLQFYNGGIALQSELPEYGEVFRDGAKSTDFWILLLKLVAVVHCFLSFVFIASTISIKEAPQPKKMNVKIHQLVEWFTKVNNSKEPGKRPSDYWFIVFELMMWMLMASGNVWETGKYDYLAMGWIFGGVFLLFLGNTFIGGVCMIVSFLIQATMYQWRFGIEISVVSSYVGLWVAMLFLFLEARKERKRSAEQKEYWELFSAGNLKVRIPVSMEEEKECGRNRYLKDILLWISEIIIVMIFPIHEFLASFSGSYMVFPKDNLPLYFFLPMILFVCLYSRGINGLLVSAAMGMWLFDSLVNASPYKGHVIFKFDSELQHGSIGLLTSDKMNHLVTAVEVLVAVLMICCVLCSVVCARRVYHEKKRDKMD